MLIRVNQACLRLWKDESGVVLATTVVIFLTLFVIASSVYAVGETIRQRVELQNAADAAAYSAAVVQADALSRIASINRAMGWTYIQQGKMCMDYIVDKWSIMTLLKWVPDLIAVKVFLIGTCYSDDWYVGERFHQKAMKQNHHRWLDVEDIVKEHKKAAGQGKSFVKLLVKILKCSINIKSMNKAEVSIIKKMDDRIDKAAQVTLKANIKELRNDKLAKSREADIRFAVLTDSKKCFEIEKSEHMFIRAVYGRGTKVKNLLGEGADTWFVNTAGTIQREYRQLGNKLVYEWWRFARRWDLIEFVCTPTISMPKQHNEVPASDFEDAFYKTAVCEPQKLAPEYFDKSGAIVVGVARRLHNPFQFMFPRKKPDGIYGLYSVPIGSEGGSRYLWSASAARAGYRDHGRPEGSYNPTTDSYEQEYDPVVPKAQVPGWWKRNNGWQGLGPYNLTETDWDAVLIPLHRAWSPRTPSWQNRPPGGSSVGATPTPGKWKKQTAADILDELWDHAKWEELYSFRKKSVNGLRSKASGDAPEGMQGTINFGQMEKDVYH